MLLACFLAALVSPGSAQIFPTRAVTMVVPYAAGGPTDTIARILSAGMSSVLGQTVVVENTTGAGGSIGVGKVARSAPDGYTLGIGHIGTHVINGAIYQLPYDLLKDFEPVAMIATNPQIVVSKNAVPAKDLKELLAWVKANPQKVSFGTGGAGTPSHISGVQFQKVTGTEIQIIHYRGAAPAMQDILAGHIDLTFDQAANSLPQIRGAANQVFFAAPQEEHGVTALREAARDRPAHPARASQDDSLHATSPKRRTRRATTRRPSARSRRCAGKAVSATARSSILPAPGSTTKRSRRSPRFARCRSRWWIG